MKLKGVNPIEQHIEKIVLGVILILLLGVISMQFVMRPNDIDVGGRAVSPDQVYSVLESRATQLQSQLSDLSPQLPELESVDLVDRYDRAFNEASGSIVALSSPLGEGVSIAGTTGTTIDLPIDKNGPVQALRVPMTGQPVAASQWATLDPYAAVLVPEYESFVPAAQPFDFASVTVEANFSGKDLESALLGNDGNGNGIPRRFWASTGIALLGFEAERQMLLSDGSWGSAEPIVTPPHTPMPINAVQEDAGLIDLSTVVNNAASVVDQVARPAFPPTISGAEWTPPSERVESDDSSMTEVERIQRNLERKQRELASLDDAPDPRTSTGRGRGNQSTTTRDPSRTQPSNRTRDRIEKLRKEIKELEDELKELGVDIEDDRPSRRSRTSRADVKSILEEESVDLWAHDLGVESGATYRYRTRVVVNNPLFRKNSELDPDDEAQQAMAREPFSRGDWSDWSEPVVVGAEEYFFVTNADIGGGAAVTGPRATVDLYKMHYGHYRKSTIQLTPGDVLEKTASMSGDLLYFDTAVIEAGEAARAVAELGDAEEGSELPDGIGELSNKVSIQLGVYLLDIYIGQGEAETTFGQRVNPVQVVLRDRDGSIVVRSELSDRGSAAYKLASESASSANDSKLREPGQDPVPPAWALFEPVEP
jgi:hypothetical protein